MTARCPFRSVGLRCPFRTGHDGPDRIGGGWVPTTEHPNPKPPTGGHGIARQKESTVCEALLNIKGENYPCDVQGHHGTHGSTEAGAIWVSSDEAQRLPSGAS